MSSGPSRSLDELVSHVLNHLSEFCKCKKDVLDLFGVAHFETGNIHTEQGTIQTTVLKIGRWGRNAKDDCWAGWVDNSIMYCYGQSGKTLFLPKYQTAATTLGPYHFEAGQHYYPNGLEPFCFISPKKFSGPRQVSLVKAAAFLDLLVEIIFVREGLRDALNDNRSGTLFRWVTDLCHTICRAYAHKQFQIDSGVSVVMGGDTDLEGSPLRPLKRPRLADPNPRKDDSKLATPSTDRESAMKYFDSLHTKNEDLHKTNEGLQEENLTLRRSLMDLALIHNEMVADVYRHKTDAGYLSKDIEKLLKEQEQHVEEKARLSKEKEQLSKEKERLSKEKAEAEEKANRSAKKLKKWKEMIQADCDEE